MTDQIYNKIITIATKEESTTANKQNTTIKITDHEGERFVFWKKNKDGNFSAVQEQFKNMGLDEGSTVKIGFVKETYTDKQGVVRNSQKIINIQETNEQPVKMQNAPVTQNSAPQREFSGNDLYGRRLALHGFVNARLVNNPISQVEQELDMLLKLENKIDSVLNPSAEPLPEESGGITYGLSREDF